MTRIRWNVASAHENTKKTGYDSIDLVSVDTQKIRKQIIDGPMDYFCADFIE